MDDQTLRVLEFDKILEKAASRAVFAPGREAVLATRPLADPAAIEREAALVTEVKDVLTSTGRFPLEEVRDIREILRRVRPEGFLLEGLPLREIGRFLGAARTLRDYVTRLDRPLPRLLESVSEIRVFRDIEDRIDATVDSEGGVLDDASRELKAIRAAMRDLDARIRALLETYVQSQESADTLQEEFVTLRDGRHVLPVKAARKVLVPGIIHGRSDTGNTIYIEPTQVVELGNDLRDLEGQEAAEVRRILAALTRDVREILPELEHDLAIITRMDAARAKAAFSIDFCMNPAVPSPEGELRLLGARHPLLLFQGAKAVPLDLALGSRSRGLVVSGPNTGGKTVALKTAGLLCLMAQAGMHVPCGERSTFPAFRSILADIGDEQSIEASLSTFSSHLTRIREILLAAGPGTLVLLDEMGAATDPEEGAALAAAILEKIHGSGASWMATTHLNALKAFARGREGVENAAMEFDEAAKRPTFSLRLGVPGSSRAMATARTLGLPEDVMESARRRLGREAAEMEALLTDLRGQLEAARAEREGARSALETAARGERELRERLEGIEGERKAVLREAHEEASKILREFREEGERALGRIQEIRKGKPESGAKEKARIEQKRLEELGRRTAAEAKRLAPPPREATGEPVREGQTVALRTVSGFGTVRKVDGKRGRAEVAMGLMTFEADLADLIPVRAEEKPRPSPKVTLERAHDVPRELHLLGMRVEEALDAMRKYLDDAVLTDREEVRIVHGFGTGALQKAVHEFLRKHESVASFRFGDKHEGSEGATVVKLK